MAKCALFVESNKTLPQKYEFIVKKVNIVRLAKFAISLGPPKLTVTVQIIVTIRIVVKSLSPESQNGKNN